MSGESRDKTRSVRTKPGSVDVSVRAKRRKAPVKARRGWPALFLLGAAFSVAVIGAASTVLYVRLLYGGMSLAAIKPAIVSALADELGGLTVQIESADVRLDDNGAFVFSLAQIAINDPDGATLASAPEARAGISWPALKRGRFALERIDLVAPRLHVAYSETSGLALHFARPTDAPAAVPTEAATLPPPTLPQAGLPEARGIDLFKAIADASGRARRRETSSGFLRSIGLREAVVVVAYGSRRTVLNVPELHIDLNHKRAHSQVAGKATLASLTGPVVIGFTSDQAENADHLDIQLTVDQANPRGLARMLPGFGMAEQIDLAVAGNAKLVVSTGGQIRTAVIEARASTGEARIGAFGRQPAALDAMQLSATYDGTRFTIANATLGWAGNLLALAGVVEPKTSAGGAGEWAYSLRSTAGTLAGATKAAPAARIDQLTAAGTVVPSTGQIGLADLLIKVAGAEITAKGDLIAIGTAPRGLIEGRISPMSAATLKAVWPTVLAPGVRRWVTEHVTKGQLAGGLFKAAVEGGPTKANPAGEAQTRLSLTLEASGVEVATAKGLPPLEIPRGLLRVEGQTIEITAADATLTATEGRKLQFKAARFTAVETAAGEQPTAEIAFRVAGPLAAAIEIADRDALQALKAIGVSLPGLDGKLDGQLKVLFPLADNVQASEVRTEGRVRLTELRARNLAANTDLSGGTVNIDVSDKAVDVKGDLLVKGVTAKLNWQYIVNLPTPQQAPIRLVAVLDTADRAALGMDIADLVLGEVPVEVTLGWAEGNQLQTRVRADLTKAELMFEPIAWKKPAGQPAMFQFDPARGPGTGAAQRLELQNVKIAGDNIAVDGWLAIGPDNKLREFSFPEFTVNVVSRLNVQGKRRPDNVWDVTAKGQTFDGRDMFRGLFNLGQATTALTRKDKTGLDLTAEIETVLGFSDTNLRSVRIKASRRDDKLTDLDLKAALPSGKPFAALVRNSPTVGRQLLAEGADAGQVFKLVGFYPNATGGLMQLEVNLDAKGPNEKSGTLWARDFSVLGDPVVSEVFQNVDSTGAPAGNARPRQRVVRQQFDFDGLSIPFDVGSGQFVMNGAAIRGPVIGATFRGKIDFKTQQMSLGGTYVPLSGLNSALGGILGPLSGGPQGEGLFGITFAVQGPLANPQVIVNPLSLLGPGIFREIFQITPEKFKINPRADGPAAPGTVKARTNAATGTDKAPARASSTPAVEKPVMAAPVRGPGEILPDWSSDVRSSAKREP